MQPLGDDPGEWLNEHGAKLVLFARQWVDCHEDAEDVFQQAFMRFWQSRDRKENPLAYLYACVRNAARNFHRASRRRRSHETEAAQQRQFAATAGDANAESLASEVEAALARLPAEQREVVVLKIWSRLTFESISGILSIPLGTAQSRYRYALRAMRRRMAEAR